MRTSRVPWLLLGVTLGVALATPQVASAGRRRGGDPHEASGHLSYASPQSNPIALSPDGTQVLVANTTSGRVDLIETATNIRTRVVQVGMDPVSIAFKPDGTEAWVANHVSDSVSVIDTDPASASYMQLIETVQDFDDKGATQFDEPVGIAFTADGLKAYVALSSRNQIATVDTVTYAVTGFLHVSAQEPRAIAVANGRLYVAAFESSNQSQLSACVNLIGGTSHCTLGVGDLINFATNPNLPGSNKNIIIDPDTPDRDVFVFDTGSDSLIKTVSGVGTLLYGLAVDGSNRVYVTQTDARNVENGITFPAVQRQDVNGDSDVNLADLGNRLFDNQIAILDCNIAGTDCTKTAFVDLDPLFPDPSTALATPYGIALSQDASTIVATAAGTSRVFTLSSAGTILDRLDLQDPGVPGDEGIPRGVAFHSSGATGTAYVLNTLANTVAVVTVGPGGALGLVKTVPVGADPTPAEVRRGRIAFNNAFGSTSGTFSCGSCHPDGNTDQLLWRIGGECFLTGCVEFEDEPRTTMPVRGLRDSLPLHWDGTLGDPFGGFNGSSGNSGTPPGSNCSLGPGGDQGPCFRQLVDASLSGVMCEQQDLDDGMGGPPDGHFRECPVGPSGLAGLLSEAERTDMAAFLERVAYPPARSRRIDDSLSLLGENVEVTDFAGNNPVEVSAVLGFEDFFFDQNGGGQPDTCADSNGGCHELPLGTSTNSEILQGFDAPTMRGLTDRFLQFSLGPTNAEEILLFANVGVPPPVGIDPLEAPIQWDPVDTGYREITTFGAAFTVFQPTYGVRPLDMFQMFEEASTGTSGATGRQVTLNSRTTDPADPPGPEPAPVAATEAFLAELEAADARGVVNLRGAGLRGGSPVTISYLQATNEYQVGGTKLTRADLIAEAQPPVPTLLATLTAQLRSAVSEDNPQPLIAPEGAQCGTGTGASGDPAFPNGNNFELEAAHVSLGDEIFLNGQPTGSTISSVTPGGATTCAFGAGRVTPDLIQISGISRNPGTDLLQIRSVANGLLSNEVPLP